MSKHAASDEVLRRTALDLVRTICEHPDYRGLMIGAVGPEVFERMQGDFAAHDSWENEGGASAYDNR